MIIGLDELDRRIDHLSALDLVKPVDKAITLVETEARNRCPTDTGELQGSISHYTEQNDDVVTGTCMTNKKYAVFVEMGTGPKGQAEHAGISPNVNPVYTQSPWWIHEGPGPNEVSRETGEKYGWFYIDTKNGRFYKCSGQAAQPFMYPALKDNEQKCVDIIKEELKKL